MAMAAENLLASSWSYLSMHKFSRRFSEKESFSHITLALKVVFPLVADLRMGFDLGNVCKHYGTAHLSGIVRRSFC